MPEPSIVVSLLFVRVEPVARQERGACRGALDCLVAGCL